MTTNIINEISKKRNSEFKHITNVANLEDLISRCTAFGITFNPSNESLKLTALSTLKTSAEEVLTLVKTTETALNNATNAREIAFEPLKKLSTKILNSLDSTSAKQQTVDDARTINRKIQGIRAPKKTKTKQNPEAIPSGEPQTISTAQLSYDSLIDHFTKLTQTVSAEPLYKPNETELKAETLNTTLANLKAVNTSVINTTTTNNNAIISRNTILYNPSTGLVNTALDVKKYVKSVYGATSPQYKQVSTIKFKNLI